jgi:hypothetical protein
MIHVGPEFLADLVADVTGRPPARLLFTSPVLDDAVLARAVHGLHAALTGAASPLERSERLTAVAALLVRRAAPRPAGRRGGVGHGPDRGRAEDPRLPARPVRQPGDRRGTGGRR